MPWWSWNSAGEVKPGAEIISRKGKLTKRGDPNEIVYGQHKTVYRDEQGRKVYLDPGENVGEKH